MGEERLRRVWSVTTIIQGGVPAPALTGWAVKATAEYAVRERASWAALADADPDAAIDLLKRARFRASGRAMARGSDLHAWAEALIKGAPLPAIDETVRPYARNFEQFLREFDPQYELAEAPCWHLDYSYAGTLDAIAKIGGRRLLLDYKTTDRPPGGTRPPYPTVALQLAAYAHAQHVSLTPTSTSEAGGRRYYTWDPRDPHAPMPELDGAAAVVIGPGDDDYQLVPVRIGDEVWRAFLHAREVFRWSQEIAPDVIGTPCRPEKGGRDGVAD